MQHCITNGYIKITFYQKDDPKIELIVAITKNLCYSLFA